jgi:hypothetical protein
MSAIEGKADGSVDAAGTAAKIGTPAGRPNCLNVSQKRDTDRKAYWARGKTKYAELSQFRPKFGREKAAPAIDD